MKKLMIVAAAAALSGSVFASDECVACGIDGRAVPGTNPAFYDITLKFKTLGPKTVTCGQCEGICMENANRTVNGIVWTCVNCDDDYPLQIALWEKSTKTQFTQDLVYGQVGGYTQYYIGHASYEYAGNYASQPVFETEDKAKDDCFAKFQKYPDTTTRNDDVPRPGETNWSYSVYTSGTNTVDTADKVYTTELDAQVAAQQLAKSAERFTQLVASWATKGANIGATDCVWATEDADLEWYRYSKKADKVEAYLQFSDNGLSFCAAGFGSFDKKTMMAKSISGNAVGAMDPSQICGDSGEILDFCEDFECGPDCWGYANTVAADDSNTFASGTWTLKANQKLANKKMLSIIPTFYKYYIEDVCIAK